MRADEVGNFRITGQEKRYPLLDRTKRFNNQWLRRIVRSPIAYAVICLGLIRIGLGFALQGMNEMVLGLDLGAMNGFLWVGLLLAWGLAASRLSRTWAVLWMNSLGLGGAIFASSRIGNPFLELCSASLAWLSDLIWRLLHHASLENVQTWNAVESALAEMVVRLEAFGTRAHAWLTALITGKEVFDPAVTGFCWMLLIWFLSTWVGWYTRRKSQPLLALAPATFTLAAGLYITRADPAPLIELCVAGLVLKTFSGNIHRWQDWQRARIPVVDIYFEWIGISLGVIIILSIGAAIAPSISVRQVARAVDQILHPPDAKEGPDYAASFGLQVRPKPVEVFENAQVSSLPARHLIGAGPELSQKVVMWVTIRGYYPASPQALAANPLLRPPRYYGRSLTYDRYTGRGWMSSPISYSSYQAGESVSWPAEALENYRTVEQQIRYSGDPDELVYAAGDLVTVDHSFLIGWRGDGDALGAHVVTPGYWAISRQPLANEALLRAAGWQYPGWVSERYLSLPTSLPARVRNLALEITAGQATLYDRVHAIEQYLRRIPYTLALPAPPYGVDIVDYFLFDLKRGYCDYLASAMVVLSRAAGIPARLATGYVSDNYDPTRARFTITKADAHSWPEIYFPDIGWVGFEPSGRLKLPGDIPSSVEPGQRSQETNPVPAPPSEADQASSKGRFPNVWVWGLIVLGLIPVSVWIGLSMERLWITRLPPLLGLETIYQRLRRSSQRFGLAVPAGVTPLELVEAFRTWGVAQGSLRKSPGNMDRMIARASSDMTALVGRYVMAVYSPAAPGKITLRWAIRTWQNLRWRLWRIATALWLYRYIFNCGHQTHPTRGETSPATRNPAARP